MAFFFLFPIALMAQDMEMKKEFSKTSPLGSSQWVSINNKFGDVQVTNWDRDEVKTEVTIIVRGGRSKAYMQKLIDSINVDYKKSDTVSFSTIIRSSGQETTTDQSEYAPVPQGKKRIEVHYKVYLPSKNGLKIINSMGNTTVPDRQGPIYIVQSFGELSTGNLPKISHMEVKFAKMNTGILGSGKIKAGYSYVNIKGLSGDTKGEFDFCKQIDITVAPNIKNLDLDLSFSKNIHLNFPDNLDAALSITTKNGKIVNGSKIPFTLKGEEQAKPVISRVYQGVSGSGKGATINVFSSLGDIRIN